MTVTSERPTGPMRLSGPQGEHPYPRPAAPTFTPHGSEAAAPQPWFNPRDMATAQLEHVPYEEVRARPAPFCDAIAGRWRRPEGPARSDGKHLSGRLRALKYPPVDGSATAAAYDDLHAWVSAITGTAGAERAVIRVTPEHARPAVPRPALAAAPGEGTLRHVLADRIWEAHRWYRRVSCDEDAREKAAAYAVLHDAVMGAPSDAAGLEAARKAIAKGKAALEDIAVPGSPLEALLAAGGAR